ncbi:hypothetical protein MVEN_01309400 [Mycena venus]|uniref:Uncharacterized protein n=1 Tax=Mycena venus TaxID=2733690 RepID=A0A8H6Y1J9_9AGAR|nr:hypothetical protein MVEN_01309400 [Mycena venus]
MADVEIHSSPYEPTFIKPLDTASRRRSRASHDSAAVSTRSWVLMNQNSPPPPEEPIAIPAPEPIPVPEPVPALSPGPAREPRPLPEPPRRTSVIVVDESGAEHMAIELPPGADGGIGYQWTTGRGAKVREAHGHKGFVGGFVSGLRRLPRALVRTRRPRRGTMHTEEGTEGTEGTGMTGNTLPRYVSNPTTPITPNASVAFLRGGLRVQQPENADDGRGPRHPSFRIVPPAEELQQDIVRDPQQELEHGDGEGGPSVLEFPQTPLENPYDRETTPVTRGPSAVTSPHLSRADDHLAAPTDLEGELDEPVSVQAHPLPTDDYRRMSAADAAQPQSRTTITSQSFSGDSPSFSSELNGWHRFFNALHVLPWVATDRLTVDYRPKVKSKTGVSWYHPEGESAAAADTARSLNGAAIASPASPASAPPRSRTRSPPRHRTHRRSVTLPDPPASAPPTAYGFPFAYYPAFSPSPPPTQQGSRRAPSPRRPHSPRHRHHRRSATYHAHTHTQPLAMPMPTPWVPSPLLPAPPAPVYIIQASPSSTPSPPPLPPSSVQATPGSVHATASPSHGMPGSFSGSPTCACTRFAWVRAERRYRHERGEADVRRAGLHADADGPLREPRRTAPPGCVRAWAGWRRAVWLCPIRVCVPWVADCDTTAGADCW